MQGIMETIFDIFYLGTVITLGILMVENHRSVKQYLLFGLMAIALGFGDAFHLVPRAYALLTDGLENHLPALGTGKFITSITMTIFYVILYHVWRLRYQVKQRHDMTIAIYALAVLRIALSIFPQNSWTSANPSLLWGILRNIPFAAMGILIIVAFYKSAKETIDNTFRHMWLTIVLSFAFYIPVVLFSVTYPAVGVLMIPKTLAYVWTVLIGYQAMKKHNRKGA